MTTFTMIFSLMAAAFFIDVAAMEGFDSSSVNNTSQRNDTSVGDTVRSILASMSLDPDRTESLLSLLGDQGLRISSKSGATVHLRDATTETDPIIEHLYAPVFARSFPSTERRTEETLLELIRNERKGISATLYELNSYAVAYELCKKHREGVEVKLIFDSGCHVSTALLLLQRCAIPMKFCSVSGGILHQKVFRFDANTGKRALLDKKHEKDNVVLKTISRLAKNDDSDKELLDVYNIALDREVALYWDGSFNITGVADQKNIESTTVVADDVAYVTRKKEFEELWKSRRSSQKKSLEEATFKATELSSNGVPSKNVFYLLKSDITINDQKELTLEAILSYKDFVPKYSVGNPADQELLSSPVELPFPCCMRIKGNNAQNMAIEVKLNDGSWIVLKDALRRSQQIQITKCSLKLHGIGDPVSADMDNWFFKLEGTNDYYELSYLQSCEDAKGYQFYGPYDEEDYDEVKIAGSLRKPRYDKGYPLRDLKVQVVRSRASLGEVLAKA
jgi:hypothetical protein